MVFRRLFLYGMKDDEENTLTQGSVGKIPDKEELRKAYESKAGARTLTVREMERLLRDKVLSRIAPCPTVKVRAKNFESYYKKYIRQFNKDGREPHLTDQMGIRIICPFIENLKQVVSLISDNFEVEEIEYKGRLTRKEFGYESIHLLVKIPGAISRLMGDSGCKVAEIQVRTTLQDAWAEVEHELFYKGDFSALDEPMQRKLHAVGASLSLADAIFQDIRNYQKKFNAQRVLERENFYKKVEEFTDDFILSQPSASAPRSPKAFLLDPGNVSIDELLLNALTLHNNEQFADAIDIYSRILAQDPPPEKPILSLIHKHRGLSYFAQSKYDEAISDFTETLGLDPDSHISAYYRGLVQSVQGQYAEAIRDFDLSLGINRFQPYCLFRRGQAYYHLGDYPQALSDCDASLAMEPKKDAVRKFSEMVRAKLRL